MRTCANCRQANPDVASVTLASSAPFSGSRITIPFVAGIDSAAAVRLGEDSAVLRTTLARVYFRSQRVDRALGELPGALKEEKLP